MPIWKDAQVPDSIPFQQSAAERPRWSMGELIERWEQEDRGTHPELGEVSEGMVEELKNFNLGSWLGRWDSVSFASLRSGLERLEQAGWDLDRLSFELQDGEVSVWISF